MGPKHTREDILAGALAVAFEAGISRLSFGRVGRSLGISDRTVVYYFPTKEDLVAAVLSGVGAQLEETVEQATSASVGDHLELLREVWPVLSRPESERTFALFFEANGLAAAGRSPYDKLVPALVSAWIGWAESRIEGSPAHRRAEAEAAIATVDGLLLLRLLAGPEAANRAAERLGII